MICPSILRNNSTVFEEMEVSIVDLTVSNTALLATQFCWISGNANWNVNLDIIAVLRLASMTSL